MALSDCQTGYEGTGPATKIGQDRTFINDCKMVKNSLFRVFHGTNVFSVCHLVGMHLSMCAFAKLFSRLLTRTIFNFCRLSLDNF